ncbi:hypothetical protein KRE47_07285 [Elizabethkingia meningoseptica]|uniref:hypothetical protein n=1 Tax=Elizabethkingia meningoseptica TaxID=238 RepID=UPI000332C160|nr:hypothetical protein [Elizabethkingia meningoseptica]AQX05394.1 hypothetical protein BBD33_09115 [Elizabethkingia meningoseptica]AQX47435.1 hypothetical protein B5G46_09105 [Elizabethkingia meningoseptica]EOR29173.1 hypothetical protein L100_12583 [Elizabethkingia meningoseptica ATCC 13253 = NBRC 12535]KUY24299.1 hypothetical protein ATB99_02000 [Elizabethkingia meningoseptica]MDE5467837.1 hypothetical protein [Elizabethkingia meningoseptica]
MKTALNHTLSIICVLFSGYLQAQKTGSKNVAVTLPIITLMDIEPAGTITLSFIAPAEAGRALVNPAANTTKWINYTSAIVSGGVSRKITASVNKLIPGVNIQLQAAPVSGSGSGTLGTTAGLVTLTTTPVTIISGIGGAYTGNGINNGHQLTISLVPNNYSNLSAQSNNPVIITYTITE